MTGYGGANTTLAKETFLVEIRGVNHRFLDIHVKASWRLHQLETKISEQIKDQLNRGRVEVSISQNRPSPEAQVSHEISRYNELIRIVEKSLLNASQYAPAVLPLIGKDLFNQDRDLKPGDKSAILVAFDEAFSDFCKSRLSEGNKIKQHLMTAFETMAKTVNSIKKTWLISSQDRVTLLNNKLHNKLSALSTNAEIPQDRLLQEAALIVSKSEIDEEVSRLLMHLDACMGLLNDDGRVGRKLEFTLQELLRESNTVAAKFPNASNHVIELKSLIENAKEHAANIE